LSTLRRGGPRLIEEFHRRLDADSREA
jgi:hypothetical protein